MKTMAPLILHCSSYWHYSCHNKLCMDVLWEYSWIFACFLSLVPNCVLSATSVRTHSLLELHSAQMTIETLDFRAIWMSVSDFNQVNSILQPVRWHHVKLLCRNAVHGVVSVTLSSGKYPQLGTKSLGIVFCIMGRGYVLPRPSCKGPASTYGGLAVKVQTPSIFFQMLIKWKIVW